MSRLFVAIGVGILLACAQATAATMTAHFIDVGQGSATLLEFSCGTVLIDLGGETVSDTGFSSNQKLRAYLEKFFNDRPGRPRRFDLLVLSHPHIDHSRGKAELLTSEDPAQVPYEIANFIDDTLNKGSGSSQQKALRAWAKKHGHYEGIKVKGKIGPDGFTSSVIDPLNCQDTDPRIRVLWGRLTPKPSNWARVKDYQNENNHSVVVRVDFGQASFLFPGDIEDKAERKLLEKYAGTFMLDVDVYLAAHHGSASSSVDDFLIAMSPETVVIPVGDPSRPGEFTAFDHGHPREEVVNRLINRTSGARQAVSVPVALGQENFHNIQMTKAIYATGIHEHGQRSNEQLRSLSPVESSYIGWTAELRAPLQMIGRN